MANLARVAQNRRFRAETGNTQEERAMVAAAEANGTRVAPEYGSPWVSTNGPISRALGLIRRSQCRELPLNLPVYQKMAGQVAPGLWVPEPVRLTS